MLVYFIETKNEDREVVYRGRGSLLDREEIVETNRSIIREKSVVEYLSKDL